MLGFYNQETEKIQYEDGVEVLYNGNVKVQPTDVLRPVHNENHADASIKAVSVAFASISIAFSFGILCWLLTHWSEKIVKMSQGEFLIMIIVGCVISSSTIFTILVDDEGVDTSDPLVQAQLDMSCMSSVWLYSLGFVFSFAALFSKTYRTHKLFNTKKKLKAIKIMWYDMLIPIIALLVIDGALLAIWTTQNPLVWVRIVTQTDKFGAIVSSYGKCAPANPDGDLWFLYLMIAVHIAVLIAANVLAFKTRTVPGAFQESKYIFMSLVSNLEIMIIGVPVIVLVYQNPTARLFMTTCIVFFNDIGVLCFIFLPKILTYHGFMGQTNADGTSASGVTSTNSNTSTSTGSEMARRKSEV
jgi:gamma-aminobutyric acid type B receptor